MDENNHHINYTAADIEKYWKGQLSAAEQHSMEKAALDDPFLADAMDGYEEKALMPKPVIDIDNNELEKRLAERLAEKQSTPVKFGWLKVAAALVLLIGAGWLYTTINHKTTADGIAKHDELKKELPVITKTDTVVTLPDSIAGTLALRDVAVNKPARTLAKNHPHANKDKESVASAPAGSASEPPLVKSEAEEKKTEEAITDKKDALARQPAKNKEVEQSVAADRLEQKAQGIATETNKTNNAMAGRGNQFPNIFNGNVIDQQNKPVANAFIQIPNLNVATQTDKRGYFSFNAADTALNVSVASDGFEGQHIHLRNKAILNQIVLTPAQNNTLNEVVTQSNGAERKRDAVTNSLSIKIPDAEPIIGWPGYNQYLEKNKKTTDETRNIHGNVVVLFDVHNKWLTNFTIAQSLDEDLDAEAIRLIKEGPPWRLLKGKKVTATVIVKF